MSRWRFLKEPFKWFLTMIRWTSKFHHQLSLACTQNSSHLYSLCVGILFNSVALGIHLQLFRERSEKACTRQSQKVPNMAIWSIHCSWHCSCRTYFCCFPLALANKCPWPLVPLFQISAKIRTENPKPPIIPFGIVACTFSDNLSRNSCIQNFATLPFPSKAWWWNLLVRRKHTHLTSKGKRRIKTW